jgi:hypothetical protein
VPDVSSESIRPPSLRLTPCRPGDRAFFEPSEDHWHGAAPNRFMTHLAMQEVDEQVSPVTRGKPVATSEPLYCGQMAVKKRLGQEKRMNLKSKTPPFAGLSLARSAGLEPATF